MKKKTYVLMISRVFPAYHPKAGQLTYFNHQILHKIDPDYGKLFITSRRRVGITEPGGKIHTIRVNYDLWARRAEQVNAGKAVISLRQWSGKPYNSKQQEFMQLEKVCVQRVEVRHEPVDGSHILWSTVVDGRLTSIDQVAENDGLELADFCQWFKKSEPKPMALIQFTDFKYE
jgi:hypothetical protein